MLKNAIKFPLLHHVDQKTIDEMYNHYSPVFILCTGRCGTKFLDVLLSKHSEMLSHHEAFPNLQYFPNYIFHNQDKQKILTQMFNAARMELVLDAYNKNKIYAESNQCIAFFAPIIKDLFKNAKFVHIVRHPGDFVRSAIRKGWYKNDSIWESGRVKMKNIRQWQRISQIEKLAWTWDATNRFVKKFSEQLGETRFISFKVENIFNNVESVHNLLNFIEVKEYLPSETIKQIQKVKINKLIIHPDEPENMKKITEFPEYGLWDAKMKNSLKKHSLPLADYYGYEL